MGIFGLPYTIPSVYRHQEGWKTKIERLSRNYTAFNSSSNSGDFASRFPRIPDGLPVMCAFSKSTADLARILCEFWPASAQILDETLSFSSYTIQNPKWNRSTVQKEHDCWNVPTVSSLKQQISPSFQEKRRRIFRTCWPSMECWLEKPNANFETKSKNFRNENGAWPLKSDNNRQYNREMGDNLENINIARNYNMYFLNPHANYR